MACLTFFAFTLTTFCMSRSPASNTNEYPLFCLNSLMAFFTVTPFIWSETL